MTRTKRSVRSILSQVSASGGSLQGSWSDASVALSGGKLFDPATGRWVSKPVMKRAVVVVETRQQRRNAARQLAKSTERKAALVELGAKVWDEVTGGTGVVLVDGVPVTPSCGKGADKVLR